MRFLVYGIEGKVFRNSSRCEAKLSRLNEHSFIKSLRNTTISRKPFRLEQENVTVEFM